MKIKLFVNLILMCVILCGTNVRAQTSELKPLSPYKVGKANYTKLEIYDKIDESPLIVKNWLSIIKEYSKTDGWYDQCDPEMFENPKYLKFMVQRSNEVKKVFKKGDMASWGVNSKGGLETIERDSWEDEWFLELNPKDLEAEGFSIVGEFPSRIYASKKCLNGISVNGANNMSSGDFWVARPKTPNNTGYTSGSVTPTILNQYNYYPAATPEPVVKQTVGYDDYIGYNQPYYDNYKKPRFQVQLQVGAIWGNQCCGYHGNVGGYCSHGQQYQNVGYQPPGGGSPQATNVNVSVYNQIVNTNTNTNTNTGTVTVTNPTNPGTPGTGSGPTTPFPGNPPVFNPNNPANPIDPYGRSGVASYQPSQFSQQISNSFGSGASYGGGGSFGGSR